MDRWIDVDGLILDGWTDGWMVGKILDGEMVDRYMDELIDRW